MRKIIILLFIVGTTTLWSCYYDSEEALYPQISTTCDVSNVTFATTVKPILQASCLSCHSNASAASSGSGIKLENYSDVLITVNNGQLMGAIKHSSGYAAMPQGGGKLTDCEISKLQKWIDNGKLNN